MIVNLINPGRGQSMWARAAQTDGHRLRHDVRRNLAVK
jgi:hypothetical protein